MSVKTLGGVPIMYIDDVTKATSKPRPTIYRESREGTFPAPVQLGKRRLAWLEKDIQDWVLAHLNTKANHRLSNLCLTAKLKAAGSDLTRQKLLDGEKEVLCWVSDKNDDDAIKHKTLFSVEKVETDGRFAAKHTSWRYAVPVPRNYYAMNDSDE